MQKFIFIRIVLRHRLVNEPQIELLLFVLMNHRERLAGWKLRQFDPLF
jgi:hypothetical protein